MDKHTNILSFDKNIIKQMDIQFKSIDEKYKHDIDNNEDLRCLFDFIIDNKKLIISNYHLKNKIRSMMNDFYVKYDAKLICKYYFDIFGKHINNLIRYSNYSDIKHDNTDMLVKYIQDRSKSIDNKTLNNNITLNNVNNDITLIII